VALQPPKNIEAIEAALVANRIAEIVERPIDGNYDAAHLREFHRFIFQDLPSTRRVNIIPTRHRTARNAGSSQSRSIHIG
jgi:hypothetical protein